MKGENTLQIILWGQQFPDTESKERKKKPNKEKPKKIK